MKNPNVLVKQTMRHILLSAGVAALGVALMIAPAQADTVTPPTDIPAEIAVPAGAVAFLVAPAVGTQNYVCLPSGSGFKFTLFTPEATLFKTDVDQQLITHFNSPNPTEGGKVRPTWQDSQDTSRFWGNADRSVTVDSKSIPWVRLSRAGVQDGPVGGDRLSETTFVQRVHTKGGLADPTLCASSSDVGTTAFVPYRADYVFYHGGLP